MSVKWGFGELDTFVGDIWQLATHALISPIHCDLRPASELASELLQRAGPEVERELAGIEHLSLGQICATNSGTLDCERIIHIAVSTLSRGPTVEVLRETLQSALLHAYHNTMRSVAIPAMFIDPGELTTSVVARITVEVSMEHLTRARHPSRIVLVVPSEYVHRLFVSEIERIYYAEPL